MSEHGRLLWYEPHTGKGVLETRSGREFRFVQPEDAQELQGGDIVEFGISGENGFRVARNVRLVQRCIDHLVTSQGNLVNLFHQTVAIPQAAIAKPREASS
jgi:hypothetical protein